MLCGCESEVIQPYNMYSKTAAFLKKSGGFVYLGLAAALAAWYNNAVCKIFVKHPAVYSKGDLL